MYKFNETQNRSFEELLNNDLYYKHALYDIFEKNNFFEDFFKKLKESEEKAFRIKIFFHYERQIDNEDRNELFNSFNNDKENFFNRKHYREVHIYLWKNIITICLFDGNGLQERMNCIWFQDIKETEKTIKYLLGKMFESFLLKWSRREEKYKAQEYLFNVEMPKMLEESDRKFQRVINGLPENATKTDDEKREWYENTKKDIQQILCPNMSKEELDTWYHKNYMWKDGKEVEINKQIEKKSSKNRKY